MSKVIIAFLFLVYGGMLHSQTWTPKDTLPSASRMATIGFSVSGKGYICNGYSNSSTLKELWEYDPVSNSWTQKANFLGTQRSGIGTTVSGRAFVGLGYNPSSSSYYYDFYEYVPSINGWIQKANYPGNGPRNNMMVGCNGKIYSGGGLHSSQAYNSDFWEYDPIVDQWTRVTTSWPLGNRASGVKFSYDSLVFFGMGYNGNQNRNDLWAYNTVTSLWTQYPSFPGVGRIHPTATVIGDKVIVGGGKQNGGNLNALSDYYILDLSTNTWSLAINHPSGSKYTAATFTIGSKGYIFGGIDSAGAYTNDLWEVEFVTTTIDESKETKGNLFKSITQNEDRLFVDLKKSVKNAKVELYSLNGSLLRSEIVNSKSFVIDNLNLETSIYLLRVLVGEVFYSKKVLLNN
ncbi:MAG: hypothetical protein CMC96_09085 [Flavobacteriales bacterium]|nr:hypothetical protein [Flavobacteriales bacterium]|tara:strand:- start:19166 stop:20374 length:1209 start_codon:yes stop_codon:yes gene_type:complete